MVTYGGNKGDERRSAPKDFTNSRKASKSRRRKSKKKSRSRKCKHGVLKSPVKLASGRHRYCKKYMGGRKGDIRKSAKKDYKKKSSRRKNKKSRRRKSKKKVVRRKKN